MIIRRVDQATISWFVLSLVIIVAAALRFSDLGGESYWFDEVVMIRYAGNGLWTIMKGGHPPLYLILAHFWIKLFGTSEFATRFLSVIFGVASIPVIYLVGKELFDRKIGLISAFLMAISQFQIYYSQDFKFYSLYVLLALASYYFFIIALRNRKISSFILYTVFTILLIYSHSFGLFVIVAHNLYFLLRRTTYRDLESQWMICLAIILIAITPRIVVSVNTLIEVDGSPLTWLPQVSVWMPLITLRDFVGAGLEYPALSTVIIGIAIFLIGTVAYFLYKGKEAWLANFRDFGSRFTETASQKNELLLLGMWISIPILVPLLLSKIFGPMYHERYVISASPPCYIVIAFLIAMLGKVVPELISLSLIVVIITPGLFDFYESPVKEQWREAARYVEDNSMSNDVIVIADDSKGLNRDTFDWYYSGKNLECSVDKFLNDHAAIDGEFMKCEKDAGRFWLIVREVPSPPTYFVEFFLKNSGKKMTLLETRRFTKITVYLLSTELNVAGDV